MIPFAEVMDDDEAVRVLSAWGLVEDGRILASSMPQISIDDPVVLALQDEMGVEVQDMPGRVVAFTRRSPTAGISRFYRVIVSTGLFQISVPQSEGGLPKWGPLHRRYAQCVGDS